jgi:hypothetical protein
LVFFQNDQLASRNISPTGQAKFLFFFFMTNWPTELLLFFFFQNDQLANEINRQLANKFLNQVCFFFKSNFQMTNWPAEMFLNQNFLSPIFLSQMTNWPTKKFKPKLNHFFLSKSNFQMTNWPTEIWKKKKKRNRKFCLSPIFK